MHHRTIAAILLAATITLGATACGTSDPAPIATPTTTSTTAAATPPGIAKGDLIAACTTALETTPGSETMPPECEALSRAEYFTAVQAANQAGRDRLASAIASAAAADGQ